MVGTRSLSSGAHSRDPLALPTLQTTDVCSGIAFSFTKRAWNILQVSTPICNEHASLDVAMEAAVRPIGDPSDVTVLHWIEMDVIDVPREIRFIANGVLPIATLPDAFLALGNFAFRPRLRFKTA